jgi:hypothetical protein
VIAQTLALLLPTVLGMALWSLLCGRPRGLAGWCAALGAGYLGGVLVWGVLLGLARGMPAPELFARLAPWLGVAAFALAAGVAWRQRAVAVAEPHAASTRGERATVVLGLVLLVLAAIAILPQASQLPTLSWDAWNAWLAKSKGWWYAGRMVEVLGHEAWIAAAPGQAITTTAPYYPDALPRVALWLASAAGDWNEGAVHRAWSLAWIALGLACFGYLRLAGCRTALALAASAGLLLLPLSSAHAVLAGYSDLWLAALVMLAAMHLAAWARQRRRRDVLAVAVFALLGVAAKLEGAVWLACLAGAALLALLPRRWRWGALLAGPLLWVAALPFGGLRLPLPGLGVVRFDWGLIEIPTRGSMTLAWRPVHDELFQALFLLPNWSLLWYLLPLVLLLRWRALRTRVDLAALGTFLALGFGFLFLLFFLTDASAWAENFTSVNRLLLQVVPATVCWLSLLWAAPARDTTPTTAA